MRRLLLIRHSKSGRKHDYLEDDHERPLNNRGERDALTMSRFLADRDESLDVIYSSTATRALDLAQMISELSYTTLVPDLSFYTFSADELLEILANLPDEAHRVAVVAHNPALLQVANKLIQAEVGHELTKLPTSGVVALDCPLENWSDIGQLACDMDYFITPKMCR